jgi:aminoglycoside phosphotransferase
LDWLIEGYRASLHPYRETGAEVYRLIHPEKRPLYLKVYRDNSFRLRRETEILRWVDQRVPTPEPLYYMCSGDAEYQLTTEVPGTPAHQVQPEEREDAVRVMAFALRIIHDLDPSGCPYVGTIRERVEALRPRLGAGDAERLSRLLERAPSEEPAFTHGDYCLPNIIIKRGRLSGVIDWDHGGLADPYVDLASCIWSMKYNYGEAEAKESWIPMFLDYYGIDGLDDEKLGFYTALMALE